VPGDQLTVLPQPGKPLRGQIQQILEASPHRIEARCAVFGQCGGCNWQHMDGATQRDWKNRIVQESLQRIGKLNDIPVPPTRGDDASAWAYRNRAQWDVEPNGPQGPKLGYHAAQSREIIEFDHCHIIPDGLNQLAQQIRSMLRENPGLAQGLKRIEAIRNQAGQTLLIFDSINRAASQALAHALEAVLPELVGVSYRNIAKPNPGLATLTGQSYLRETLAGQTYQLSAGSFFQTNLHGASQLLNVLDEAIQPAAKSLLDIYAGVGVFALHFSNRISRVLAVESSHSAIADAKQNLSLNGVKNVELSRGEARAVLHGLKEDFDVAIVDPPRAGCTPEVLTWINKYVKQQLLYVSCNPTTLARDLKTLAAAGWKVESVQTLDMFPQTYHIECVANLSRP
jgi:23S rRNA (uracil1939-C5)-methyltransferase